MLKAECIHKYYPTRGGRLEVLRGIDLALDGGESAVIMGPSGSGKSTLLNILGTLEPPSEGRVVIGQTNPFDLPEAELARFRNTRIGFIFQDDHLLPQCSLLENVLLPSLARRRGGAPDPSRDRQGAVIPIDPSRDRKGAVLCPLTSRAKELIERVGLADRLDHRPAELSGGERQRAAIARALINRPDVVLADEPTGNLDQASAADVADLLCDLQRDAPTILIIVTHSTKLAERFSRRYVLEHGQLEQFGE